MSGKELCRTKNKAESHTHRLTSKYTDMHLNGLSSVHSVPGKLRTVRC